MFFELDDVFGKKHLGSGAPDGLEFQVNNYTLRNQQNPRVVSLSDGGFIVVWQSDDQDGEGLGIFGQIYAATGAPNGLEFQINNYTTGDQRNPSVASLNDGGFVVVWESDLQDGDRSGIFGQRYDRNGIAIPLSDIPLMSSASISSLSSASFNPETTFQSPSVNMSDASSPSSVNVESTSAFGVNSTNAVNSNSEQSESSSTSRASTQSGSEVGITPVIVVSYEPISVNGFIQDWSVVDGVLYIDFSPTVDFEDGEEITLFTFANSESTNCENLIVEEVPCLEDGSKEVRDNGDGTSSYVGLFEVTDRCTTQFADGTRLSTSIQVLGGTFSGL